MLFVRENYHFSQTKSRPQCKFDLLQNIDSYPFIIIWKEFVDISSMFRRGTMTTVNADLIISISND